MFRLDNQDAKLMSVTPLAECHGEDHKMAVALKFKTTMGNQVLDSFNKDLRPLLFKKPAPEDMDLADEMMDGEDYLVALRFREIKKLPWDYEGAGYRMVVQVGVSGEEDIILINSEIDKFSFECKQGGSVDVEFRVKGHPNETEMGRLCAQLQNDVDLTLEPPSAEKRAQMELDAMGDEDDEQEEAA